MVAFDASTVMGMLALIEATVVSLFVGMTWFIWEHYPRKEWVKRRFERHNRNKHK